jgi:Uma2 family endonuclease
MNERSLPGMHPTTQAAEGLPRWRWSLSDFDRLHELGVLGESDRVELIGGELVPMQAKGGRHELVKTKLLNWMMRLMPDELEIAIELGWRPDDATYLEPDILIYETGPSPSFVAPSQVLLAVEVADTSLAYDAGRKAQLYAALGVREYWVVNAETLATLVHRSPTAAGYGAMAERPAEALVAPTLVPALAVRLADLAIG